METEKQATQHYSEHVSAVEGESCIIGVGSSLIAVMGAAALAHGVYKGYDIGDPQMIAGALGTSVGGFFGVLGLGSTFSSNK